VNAEETHVRRSQRILLQILASALQIIMVMCTLRLDRDRNRGGRTDPSIRNAGSGDDMNAWLSAWGIEARGGNGSAGCSSAVIVIDGPRHSRV